MKRLEFLALLASPVLVFTREKEVTVNSIAKHYDVPFGPLHKFESATYEPYKMTAKHLKVSHEAIDALNSWNPYAPLE